MKNTSVDATRVPSRPQVETVRAEATSLLQEGQSNTERRGELLEAMGGFEKVIWGSFKRSKERKEEKQHTFGKLLCGGCVGWVQKTWMNSPSSIHRGIVLRYLQSDLRIIIASRQQRQTQCPSSTNIGPCACDFPWGPFENMLPNYQLE